MISLFHINHRSIFSGIAHQPIWSNVEFTTVVPPSITKLCPLTKPDSSEAKNSTAAATSAGFSTAPLRFAPAHDISSSFAASTP
ncbi:hypothetical protein IEQ34_022021 [Dendrobium chrysotoxum]|uniref:Uncharacterized protein n=1 Tax=Dendrobium chrysotoxum TaxID=161865 RepID=A0AAV7FWM0_DENCH|nr:hypothetical protein IEQ34_022021 [Dendrobium chrysotoxum]